MGKFLTAGHPMQLTSVNSRGNKGLIFPLRKGYLWLEICCLHSDSSSCRLVLGKYNAVFLESLTKRDGRSYARGLG